MSAALTICRQTRYIHLDDWAPGYEPKDAK